MESSRYMNAHMLEPGNMYVTTSTVNSMSLISIKNIRITCFCVWNYVDIMMNKRHIGTLILHDESGWWKTGEILDSVSSHMGINSERASHTFPWYYRFERL